VRRAIIRCMNRSLGILQGNWSYLKSAIAHEEFFAGFSVFHFSLALRALYVSLSFRVSAETVSLSFFLHPVSAKNLNRRLVQLESNWKLETTRMRLVSYLVLPVSAAVGVAAAVAVAVDVKAAACVSTCCAFGKCQQSPLPPSTMPSKNSGPADQWPSQSVLGPSSPKR